MTQLQLVQQLWRESAYEGDPPSTVAGSARRQKDVVRWINDAWKEIQEEYENWLWMRHTVSYTTSVSEVLLSMLGVDVDTHPKTGWARWKIDYRIGRESGFLIQDPNVSDPDSTTGPLYYVPWLDYRNIYYKRPLQSGRPSRFTITEGGNIQLLSSPDKQYKLFADYYHQPWIFTGDGTEYPDLPDRFHEMIVWKALMAYANAEDANERFQYATGKYNNYMYALRRDYLPRTEDSRELKIKHTPIA